MEIFWLGHSSFRIKGKVANVLIDQNGVSVEDKQFSGPGEYESKGVMITGINDSGNTIFQVAVDGLNVVHLGSPDNLTREKLEGIEETHILLTPISSSVSDLEPQIIIPYADSENLGKLLKELGAESNPPQGKLVMTKDKLPEEPMVMVLAHG